MILLRVAGIGDGLFAIFIVLFFAVMLCVAGTNSEKPACVSASTFCASRSKRLVFAFFNSYFCVASVAIVTVIVLFFVLMPKEPLDPVEESSEPVRQLTSTDHQTRMPRRFLLDLLQIYDSNHPWRVGLSLTVTGGAVISLFLALSQFLTAPIIASRVRPHR